MFTGFGICPICSCYAVGILENHKLGKEKILYEFSASNTALEKCKLCLYDLEYVLYAAVMLLRF